MNFLSEGNDQKYSVDYFEIFTFQDCEIELEDFMCIDEEEDTNEPSTVSFCPQLARSFTPMVLVCR